MKKSNTKLPRNNTEIWIDLATKNLDKELELKLRVREFMLNIVDTAFLNVR